SFYVQVGAYSQQANAAEVRNALIRNGFAGTRIETKGAGGRVLHLVKAGPFANKTQADQALARLQTAYPSSFVASL
ncbi:MAG: SPOR domain-containing protein, partial [Proteobacteria bacterium]|nr:SPOR domain-containing protein [Pseudomonadota bacterium]